MENIWWRGAAKAMEQYFNRLGTILSRPLALFGPSDVNASRMSDSDMSMLLGIFELAGVGRSGVGGNT